SLFGASVTAVALPELSRDAVAPNAAPNEQLRARIALGFRRIVFFVVPSSVACIALSREIVAALYQTGRFTVDDTALLGSVYAALTLALKHPDAVRTWQSLTAFRAN